MNKKKFILTAKEVITLEIKALQKLKKISIPLSQKQQLKLQSVSQK